MAKFKTNGFVDFKEVLCIYERLPKRYEVEPELTVTCLTAALFMAFESMNLSRPMNEAQIIELVDTIIDSSGEDNLALEDVVLFLQGLTRGKYGALYESMDIPKFMEKFEIYRQERHQALQNHRYEQHCNFKALGSEIGRSCENDIEKDLHRAALSEHLKNLYK